MTCKKIRLITLILFSVMTFIGSALAATPATVLVVPARLRVVELAFQVAQLKDIGIVSYNSAPNLTQPLIHVWTGSQWEPITVEDYIGGTFMTGKPDRLILLGDSTTLPERMTADPAWCSKTYKIATLDTASLVNQFGRILQFTPGQWEWLADRNGLSLTDRNSERRRYGRWGAPGKEKDALPFKIESVEMPPEPAVKTEPKVIQVPVVAAPAAVPQAVEMPKTAVPPTPPEVKPPATVKITVPVVPTPDTALPANK